MEILEGVYFDDTQRPAEKESVTAADTKVDFNSIAINQREKLVKLLKEMKEATAAYKQIISKVKPKFNEDSTVVDGISLLQVRNKLFMRYMCSLSEFVKMKVEGGPLDQTIDDIVTNRTIVDKIRPLEKKLSYQITKYTEMQNQEPQTTLRANPAAMMTEDHEDSSEEMVSSQYKAPQISSTLYPKASQDLVKEARYAKSVGGQSKQSQLIAEFAEGMMDNPHEEAIQKAFTREAKQFMERQKEIEKYEEEHFTRIPKSKKDKEMMKKLSTMDGSLKSILDYEKMHKKKHK